MWAWFNRHTKAEHFLIPVRLGGWWRTLCGKDVNFEVLHIAGARCRCGVCDRAKEEDEKE